MEGKKKKKKKEQEREREECRRKEIGDDEQMPLMYPLSRSARKKIVRLI